MDREIVLHDRPIDFGGDVPELGFNLKEWNDAYGQNRHEQTRRREAMYRDECNAERIRNGLNPI